MVFNTSFGGTKWKLKSQKSLVLAITHLIGLGCCPWAFQKKIFMTVLSWLCPMAFAKDRKKKERKEKMGMFPAVFENLIGAMLLEEAYSS